MSKKIIKLAAISTIGAAVVIGAGSGITYQVKWSSFKKDFANHLNKLPNGAGHFLKLDSTSGHTVTYKSSTTVLGEKFTITVSEHYKAFAKFKTDKTKIVTSGSF